MNRYQMELDHITVPESTVDQLKERAAAPRKKANWHRPVAVAACLALMVAIPVGAAVKKLVVDYRPVEELPEYMQLEHTAGGFVVENPYHVEVEAFSEELQQFVASLAPSIYEPQSLYFDSWEEAESFIGIHLFDNPVLDNAEKLETRYLKNGEVEAVSHCKVDVDVSNLGGIRLQDVDADAWYRVNKGSVQVAAHFSTAEEGSVIGTTQRLPQEEMEDSVQYGSVEKGVTASGLEYSIAYGQLQKFGGWRAEVFLIIKDATVNLTFYNPDESTLRETVQQVMDGFQ